MIMALYGVQYIGLLNNFHHINFYLYVVLTYFYCATSKIVFVYPKLAVLRCYKHPQFSVALFLMAFFFVSPSLMSLRFFLYSCFLYFYYALKFTNMLNFSIMS